MKKYIFLSILVFGSMITQYVMGDLIITPIKDTSGLSGYSLNMQKATIKDVPQLIKFFNITVSSQKPKILQIQDMNVGLLEDALKRLNLGTQFSATYLDFSNNHLNGDFQTTTFITTVLDPMLRRCTHVQHLNLGNMNLDDKGFQTLSHVLQKVRLPHLTQLDLYNNSCTLRNAETLTHSLAQNHSGLPVMHALNLKGCGLEKDANALHKAGLNHFLILVGE